MSPVAGGWAASYFANGIEFQGTGMSPQAVVNSIAQQMLINKLKPDILDIQFQLEIQWHRRAPDRFIRPPERLDQAAPEAKQEETVSPARLMNAISSFLNLSYRSDLKLEEFAETLLQIFEKKQVGCKHCAKIVRQVMTDAPDDWRYELQIRLNSHFEIPSKPKQLIAKEWGLSSEDGNTSS